MKKLLLYYEYELRPTSNIPTKIPTYLLTYVTVVTVVTIVSVVTVVTDVTLKLNLWERKKFVTNFFSQKSKLWQEKKKKKTNCNKKNGVKTLEQKMWQNSKTQIVTQIVKLWQNSY